MGNSGIARWFDLSGSGNVAVQSNTSKQPIYTTANNSINFNGSNQYFTIPNNPGFKENKFEYFIVTEYKGDANATSQSNYGSPFTKRTWPTNGHNILAIGETWRFWTMSGSTFNEAALNMPSSTSQNTLINATFENSSAMLIQN